MENSDCCFNKLPKHVWELLIFSRLTVKDLIRSGIVCRLWRSIAGETFGRLHRLPWLMISRDRNTQIGTFLCLSDAQIYHLMLTTSASESYCCGGSSQGYLIMANWKSNFLFNPFSKISIDLPKQYVSRKDMSDAAANYDFRYYFVKAAICSSSEADTSQCVVAALCSNPGIIEVCRPQHIEWSVFGVEKEEDKKLLYVDWDELFSDDVLDVETVDRKEYKDEEVFLDILFYKGMLYGLTRNGGIVTFSMQDSELLKHTVLNVVPMIRPKDQPTVYLVESCGKLLMVYRNYVVLQVEMAKLAITTKFVAYKLDQSSSPFQWVQVQSLGDQMLFLGKNASLSISAKSIPGFKGNCIYFSDDDPWDTFWKGRDPLCLCSDNGVFYMEDGHIESFFPPDNNSHSFKTHPAVWVTPIKL